MLANSIEAWVQGRVFIPSLRLLAGPLALLQMVHLVAFLSVVESLTVGLAIAACFIASRKEGFHLP